MNNLSVASALAVLALAALFGQPAHAVTNATMTTCFEQWQSAKDAGTEPKGELWADYYKKCAARLKKGSSAAKKTSSTTRTKAKKPAANEVSTEVPPEPTDADRAKAIPTKDASGKALSAGEIAFRRRIKKCGVEWHQDQDKGDLPENETWPQFWSACNMRLKKEGIRG
jgi:hypothetical protein